MMAQETAQEGMPETGWQRFRRFPVTRIVTYLLLLAALAAALYLPVRGIVRLLHIPARGNGEVAALVSEIYLALCAVLAYVIMVRMVERRSLATTGLAFRGVGKETAAGLLIGGGLFSLVIGLMAALGSYHVIGMNWHFAWLVPLILFLFTGVFEEVIFRGYFFQTLENRWGSGIALAGSGAAFGLVHLLNPVQGVSPAEKLAGPVFIVFEASILMTAAYLLTRRLWLPIGIHWGWNFFENAVYGAADSGLPASPVYTLLHAHFSGPFVLTGGPFGPEASVLCFTLGTGAGLLLLRLAVRRGQWKPGPRFRPALLPPQEALP